jgi:hypothetical protein
MIRIGLDDAEKATVVNRYVAEHGIKKLFVLSPERFAPTFAAKAVTRPDEVDGRAGLYIPWPEHIEYRYYYRVIDNSGPETLIVVNECLRGQQRTMLNFNCVRTFLRHSRHQIIFQYLPVIDGIDDVMTLIDFDTRSQWWDQKFDRSMLAELDFQIRYQPVTIEPVRVQVDDKIRAAYSKEKAALLAEVRGDPDKDPHLIPRNLLLVSGKAKLPSVDPARRYVGRNNRFKLPNLETYRDASGHGERVVLELPHNVIEMADLLAVSRQHRIEVLVADTKAEDWYLRRFQDWAERVNDAHVVLHG